MKNYVSVPRHVAQSLPDEAFTFPAERGYSEAANAPNMIRERRGMGIVLQAEFIPENEPRPAAMDCEAAAEEAPAAVIGQFDLF